MLTHLRLFSPLVIFGLLGLGAAAGQDDKPPLPSGALLRLSHKDKVLSLAVSPDGKVVACGYSGGVSLWDVDSGALLRQLPWKGVAGSVAWLPDGKTLLAAEAGAAQLWDSDSGRELRQLQPRGVPPWGAGPHLVLTPDGKTAVWGHRQLTLVDVSNGKPLPRVPPMEATWPAAFSPDGKMLIAAPYNHERQGVLTAWNIASGKLVRRLAREGHWEPEDRVAALAFTPEGRSVVGACTDGTVRLWEAVTGRQQVAYWTHGRRVSTVAVSADGRFVVSGGDDLLVRVRDLVLETEVLRLGGHRGKITAVAFTPDGQRVLSASEDGTVLVWRGPGQPGSVPPADLSAEEREAAWKALGGPNAALAYRTVRRLLAAPGPSVALLRERIRPVSPPDPGRLEKLITDLDSARFATRDAAARALEKLGRLAEPALRKAAEASPNEELRRRAVTLLARLPTDGLGADELQRWRALEVLERAGTPEARRLLEDLAGGAPGALRTKWARAALERLRRAGR
ncbi:MAG: hypothetical protein L0Z62_48170 [Gemmataceae bacterium]|nr:hypothetical protein [Gemmataceae bacterium]